MFINSCTFQIPLNIFLWFMKKTDSGLFEQCAAYWICLLFAVFWRRVHMSFGCAKGKSEEVSLNNLQWSTLYNIFTHTSSFGFYLKRPNSYFTSMLCTDLTEACSTDKQFIFICPKPTVYLGNQAFATKFSEIRSLGCSECCHLSFELLLF